MHTVSLLQESVNKDEILDTVFTTKCLVDIFLSDRFCAAVLAAWQLASVKKQVKLEAWKMDSHLSCPHILNKKQSVFTYLDKLGDGLNKKFPQGSRIKSARLSCGW